MRAFDGIGIGTGSLSLANVPRVTGTLGCEPASTWYGIPIVWLWNVPAPKSGWRVTVGPMKLMIFAEFGSTEAVEMSVFHRLEAGNGTKPLRFAPGPRLMPLHEPAWPKAYVTAARRIVNMSHVLRRVRIVLSPFLDEGGRRDCSAG